LLRKRKKKGEEGRVKGEKGRVKGEVGRVKGAKETKGNE
jgi:hypothetical protein